MIENDVDKRKENIDKTTPDEANTIINSSTTHQFYFLSLLIALISVITIIILTRTNNNISCNNNNEKVDDYYYRKKFWIYGKNTESTGHLENVFTILDRLGYTYLINDNNNPSSSDDDWDLLWAHDYPFRQLYVHLNHMQAHQKVNHFPGCGYITNKVDLATSGLKFIPDAFKLPQDKDRLLSYASTNPSERFVQKNNDHRNIKIRQLNEIDLNSNGTFIQKYVERPLLVDGHKFDIGIYVIVTSIDPLRVYIYNGDVLLRFCPIKYYPFDPEQLDKYVVGDDYLPIWEVPSLSYYYNELGFGMRDSLNALIASRGQNPNIIWEQIEESIRIVMLANEAKILDVVRKFKSKRNFFEMMRFDFVIDENLDIYLLEANMSPNLSSAHFPPNQLLYQQVLYNMMGLLGLGERLQRKSSISNTKSEEAMLVSDKGLATFPKQCNSLLCRNSCMSPDCQLCKPCLSPDTRRYLVQAYKEHVNRGDCKRIFPPQLTRELARKLIDFDEYSAENQLQYRWFKGKCLLDSTWC